mmetsp:Transcript_19592/g.26332  ORF Transcript_19592/g.26332 Transcript_19592/m.26332 type:complete len:145 (+) Transcript_19592:44-478(+)
MAWSLSVLGVAAWPLLNAISASALPRLSQFSLQHLSNPAWSLSKFSILDDPLLAAISSEASPKLREATCQDLVSMASAFAGHSILDKELSNAISEESQRRINDFDLPQKRRLEEIFLGIHGDDASESEPACSSGDDDGCCLPAV